MGHDTRMRSKLERIFLTQPSRSRRGFLARSHNARRRRRSRPSGLRPACRTARSRSSFTASSTPDPAQRLSTFSASQSAAESRWRCPSPTTGSPGRPPNRERVHDRAAGTRTRPAGAMRPRNANPATKGDVVLQVALGGWYRLIAGRPSVGACYRSALGPALSRDCLGIRRSLRWRRPLRPRPRRVGACWVIRQDRGWTRREVHVPVSQAIDEEAALPEHEQVSRAHD